MISRQNWRIIIRGAVFIIALIGLPFFALEFFYFGTLCFIDPFFYIQRIGILGGTLIGINEGATFDSEYNTVLMTFTVGSLVIFTVIFGRAFCS